MTNVSDRPRKTDIDDKTSTARKQKYKPGPRTIETYVSSTLKKYDKALKKWH